MFSIKRWRAANPNHNPQTEKRIDTVLKTIIAFLIAYGCLAIGYGGYACLSIKQNLDKEVTETNESTDERNRLKMSTSIIFLLVILIMCMFMK